MTEPSSDTREKRSGVIIRAAIARDGASVERRVRNLSPRGACVDNVQDLAAGDVVTVAMGSLHGLIADVMWAKPQLAGLRFRSTVDLDAARKPRAAVSATARAGWMADMGNAYRRDG
jgi:hypothetical protein